MTMNSKKASSTLGMAAALTLGIAIMFASPLSATMNMGGSGMMMSSSAANNTTITSKTNLPTATFNSAFDMVMLNGSALHKHQTGM